MFPSKHNQEVTEPAMRSDFCGSDRGRPQRFVGRSLDSNICVLSVLFYALFIVHCLEHTLRESHHSAVTVAERAESVEGEPSLSSMDRTLSDDGTAADSVYFDDNANYTKK